MEAESCWSVHVRVVLLVQDDLIPGEARVVVPLVSPGIAIIETILEQEILKNNSHKTISYLEDVVIPEFVIKTVLISHHNIVRFYD